MLNYIEGPKNILSDDLFRLQHMISWYQLAKGNKRIEPVAVSDDEDEYDEYFLDLEFYGLVDDYINDALQPCL